VLLLTFSSMDEFVMLQVNNVLPGSKGMHQDMKGTTDIPPPESDVMSNTDPFEGGEEPHSRPEDRLAAHNADGGTAQADDQVELDLNSVGDGLLIAWDSDYSFAPGSTEVNPRLRKALVEFAEVLRFYPHQIVLEGHAASDHRPTAKYPDAEAISLARAMSAAEVLVGYGIEEGRIQITGMGNERPRSITETAASRHSNRRVELRVLTLGTARMEQLKSEWREKRQREGGL